MMSTPGAAGARPGRIGLRTLSLAVAASCGTGLLLAACSASSAGRGTASSAGRALQAAPAPRKALHAAGSAGSSSGTLVALSAQDIIRTADLRVRVKKATTPAAQANVASALVTGVGGYVSGEQDLMPPGGSSPQVTLQLKVPSARYGAVLARLAALGRQLSESQHATDVTQRVADVGSRVASARAAIRQLRALLRKAGSVSALLSVQNEINTQESNLEALLAQQRALARQTSYATVTLVLIGHRQPTPVQHKKEHVPGFLAGLRAGWHAFALAVGWLLTALGSLLPFLILAAALAAIAIAIRRRLGRRRQPPAPEPPATPAA